MGVIFSCMTVPLSTGHKLSQNSHRSHNWTPMAEWRSALQETSRGLKNQCRGVLKCFFKRTWLFRCLIWVFPLIRPPVCLQCQFLIEICVDKSCCRVKYSLPVHLFFCYCLLCFRSHLRFLPSQKHFANPKPTFDTYAHSHTQTNRAFLLLYPANDGEMLMLGVVYETQRERPSKALYLQREYARCCGSLC